MTRVLVVDDEIDTLNLLRTILEISGYQAFTTLNSVEAIMLAEMEHPDCVLLDIMMPQLDGFTLCKMMRLHPATMHLPIIFVTAYSALDIEERRLEAGADMVLPKPIGMDALIEAVEKAQAIRATKTAEIRAVPQPSNSNPASASPVAPAVPVESTVENKPAPQPAVEAKPEPLAENKPTPEPTVEAKPVVEAAPTAPVTQPAPVASGETAKPRFDPLAAPLLQPKPADPGKPVAASTPAQPPFVTGTAPKAESGDGGKPGLKTVVDALEDLPVDIGISPDEEPARETPAATETPK